MGELGGLLLHKTEGRTRPEEITLFKGLGLAIEDLAAANYIYHQAVARQQGTQVDM
ncbi:ornithine cyclodeaminase [compost metagenome]